MRASSGILIVMGVLLSAAVIFLLLFWFAFPQWWPEVVIRHSPSLSHVLFADSHRFEQASEPTASGGVIYPDQRTADYSRFEKRLGVDIYAAMVAYDDGRGGRVRASIIRYLGEHLKQQKARILLWKYRDAGDDSADWVLRQYTNSIHQGVDLRPVIQQKDDFRPSRERTDEWK